MGFWVGNPSDMLSDLKGQIASLTEEVGKLTGEREALKKQRDWHAEVIATREQLETLKIEKARIEEEQARKMREVQHDTGLLRKQVETETKLATQEAVLAVKKENLAAERALFEEQMKFTTDRFEKEVGYLHELMAQVLKRLPDVSEHITIAGKNGNGKAPAKTEA